MPMPTGSTLTLNRLSPSMEGWKPLVYCVILTTIAWRASPALYEQQLCTDQTVFDLRPWLYPGPNFFEKRQLKSTHSRPKPSVHLRHYFVTDPYFLFSGTSVERIVLTWISHYACLSLTFVTNLVSLLLDSVWLQYWRSWHLPGTRKKHSKAVAG